MSDGIIVNGVKQQLLDVRVVNPPFDTLVIGLWTGVLVPTANTVLGNLTLQTGTGYAEQPLSGWSAAIMLANGKAFSAAAPVSFDNSGGTPWTETTGWYWRDTTLDQLVAVQRYLVPFVVSAGRSYPTTPFLTQTGG